VVQIVSRVVCNCTFNEGFDVVCCKYVEVGKEEKGRKTRLGTFKLNLRLSVEVSSL
jgi:hypothetical protein